ncbi:myosin heavy chain kinase [Tieghemostelium lacteum]|uniref:Myosin heavy chain kinase n=1 Tax=Tieghemostelium lacteum TaxID=361077 RepID=A0A152A944_TIELA|nr:myosin heavy chain kinase [Tieghemostelium lacteum]|eukprot:KYR02645.1 myosin heavy chain kinase [Tieghemostelium lacteum]
MIKSPVQISNKQFTKDNNNHTVKDNNQQFKKEESVTYNTNSDNNNNNNRNFDIEFEVSKLKEMNMFSKKKKEEKLTPGNQSVAGGTPIVNSSSTSSGSLMSGIQDQAGNGISPLPQSPQPFTSRSCTFKKFGCSQYIVSKGELDNHMKEDAQFHLQLVVEKFDHQFDLHTQLMAHFTEQMEDQLEKIMKVVRNHMDSFGTQLQSKIDEGVEKSITFTKKVEQQQQQLAKRLITQQIVQSDQKKLSSPLVKGGAVVGGELSVDLSAQDGASSMSAQVIKQMIESEIQLVSNRFKREHSELADELNKLADQTQRDRKSVESDIQRKADLAAMNLESQILKKLEDKEKRKTENAQLSVDTKIESIRDKLKLIESTQIESSSEIRKIKLDQQKYTNSNSNSPVVLANNTTSFSGFVPSLAKENSFQKSEIMEEFKKLEDRLGKKIVEEQNTNKSEIADIQRGLKQSQTDLLDLEKDCKNQFDKQGRQVKQVEDDLKKTDSLVMLMQNNLKKYNEYVEKEKDRESERLKLLDQIKQLEISQKRIEAEIQEGNEQVERVLREEANNTNGSASVGGMSPISSIPKSPLLIKRSSMIISPPNSSPKSTETRSTQPSEDGENGILWEYDPVVNKWIRLAMKLKVERKAFAEGALREAYHTVSLGVTTDEAYPLGNKHSFPSIESISPLSTRNEAFSKLKSGTKFVLKLYKKEAESQVSRELYFEDVKMQMVCRDWGNKFNQKKPPKKIEFLMSWVVELVDRSSNGLPVLCCIEPLLVGEFKKNNSNYGAVLNNRSTPQAFSHFTYENSNKQLIIVDIQGVDDLYTDPQIHTNDGKGFGLGNLGKTGINKFITTHKCNAVCALLDLDVKLGGVLPTNKKQLQGTMVMPDIASELEQYNNGDEFKLKVGAKDLPKAEFNKKELKCINTISSFRERVNCITFFDQKKLICAGYGDGQFRVFDIKDNYKCIHTVNGHRKSIESICANSQYLFTSSPDHTIKVHSLRSTSTRCIETLMGHSGEVSSIVCNEKYLFSCSYDKSIKVWDLTTFKEIKSFEGVHTKYIKSLCLSGRYLFSGGNDQTIYVWDTENLTCLFNMQGHEDWVLNLHCSGTYLFSTSKDNVIKIWDLNDFHCIDTLKGHWSSVCTSVVKDRYLYSGSEDNSIKVWDLDTLECVYTVQKSHTLGVKTLLIYDNQLISASFDGTIKTWDWQSK